MVEWKNIDGYEGLYMVSSDGRVKSLPKGKGNGNKSRILKLESIVRNHTAYHRVSLSKDGKVKRFQVHRLVAFSFIDLVEGKDFVNHIDNNGANNNVSNLEWVTHSENMIHAEVQGRLSAAQSKGGKLAGQVIKKQRLDEYSRLIGNKFGKWKFLELDTSKQSGNWHGIMQCDCGNTNSVNLSTVIRGLSRQCRSCGLREAHKRRKIKI